MSVACRNTGDRLLEGLHVGPKPGAADHRQPRELHNPFRMPPLGQRRERVGTQHEMVPVLLAEFVP